MATSPRVLFSPLPDGESRLRFLGAGFMLECVGVVLLVGIPLLMPQKLEMIQQHWITPIAAPPVVPWKPQPPPPKPKAAVMKPVIAKVIPPPQPVVAPEAENYDAGIYAPVAKPATAKRQHGESGRSGAQGYFRREEADLARQFRNSDDSKAARASANWRLRRSEWRSCKSEQPWLAKYRREGRIRFAAGSGIWKRNGWREGCERRCGQRGIRQWNCRRKSEWRRSCRERFRPAVSVQRMSPRRRRLRNRPTVAARTEPIEIISKPRPTYTKEAKDKKIEGDVVVQVVFMASGQVQVQRVIRGLGYGLDEAAQEAARQIKFKPARQDGQPVDFAGNVHITFELAY